jgi:hypothetical protein
MSWHLEGYDAFDGEYHALGAPLAPDDDKLRDGVRPSYESYDEAMADARKRLAYLEKTQPSSWSGGQGFFGIQDQVFIVHPGGRRERVC